MDAVSVAAYGMSAQLLFVRSACPLWLFSGPFSSKYPMATMAQCIYIFE